MAAAIPQPSTPTTTSTQQSTDAAAPASDPATRLVAPPPDALQPKSLVQQVLDALEDTRIKSEKVRKYLPDFLKKLHEDLKNELREKKEVEQKQASEVPAQTGSAVFLAYQSFSHTSFALSIHS